MCFFFFFNCVGNDIPQDYMNREPRSLSLSECSGSTKSEFGAPEKLTERSDSGAEGDAEERRRSEEQEEQGDEVCRGGKDAKE